MGAQQQPNVSVNSLLSPEDVARRSTLRRDGEVWHAAFKPDLTFPTFALQAVKWLEMLSSLVPNDPGVLARLGAIFARQDDETRALHYYQVGCDAGQHQPV